MALVLEQERESDIASEFGRESDIVPEFERESDIAPEFETESETRTRLRVETGLAGSEGQYFERARRLDFH